MSPGEKEQSLLRIAHDRLGFRGYREIGDSSEKLLERERQSIILDTIGVLNDPRKYNMPFGKRKCWRHFQKREKRSFSTLGYKAAKVALIR